MSEGGRGASRASLEGKTPVEGACADKVRERPRAFENGEEIDMSFLPYGHQWIDEEDIAAVVAVLRGDWLSQGPAVEVFEEKVASFLGVRHAVAFSSGTSALHGAYWAAGVGPGDVVVTSPLTFAATSNGALYTGAEVRFADVDPDTYCLSPLRAAEAAGPETKAFAPVSFAGYPADVPAFLALAEKTGAVVIEDACHALGGDREGRKVGRDAHLTALSFHPVKHITTGEGGMVVTESDAYADRLRRFRSHGIVKDPKQFLHPAPGPWYTEMQHLGYNYRLSDIQCALGTSQMKRLDDFVARRRQLAGWYGELLKGVERVRPAPVHPGHAWHLYPLWVEPAVRRQVFDGLRAREIGVQVHYVPVSLHPYYVERYGLRPGNFPEAEKVSSGEISLPMFPAMEDGDVDRVVQALKEILADLS